MLDTNICIYLIKKHPPEIVEKFDNYRRGEICISSITWAELCCGIKKDGAGITERLLELLAVVPFGVEDGRAFGRLTGLVPSRKASLDRMIAAHALSLGVTLITNNPADFEAYKPAGLLLENWLCP
ncbi:MAG: type II toxin-antitoxin system VapC family toxin [Deltaproteobacteria bacterium]|jgi:tRNA(fMet)-specific endonuclease VapC|nr:type II toxin-antitoxin system VapC family toxin [Deltaproteobacteria bacterium]